MLLFAHAVDVVDSANSDVWDWSSPLGLGVFIVGIALTLFLLSWTIKNLASIPPGVERKRR